MSKLPLFVVALAIASSSAWAGGAVRTVNKVGQLPSSNAFAAKADVYLSGGAQVLGDCQSPGLPDGEYYFQVTDPAGSCLLTNDSIDERRVLVVGGVVAQYLGQARFSRSGGACSSTLVQLAPFDDSPCATAEYKLWLTPVGSYDPKGGGFFGFEAAHSKTDSFVVGGGGNSLQTKTFFRGYKFFDHSEDGVWNPQVDPLEVPIPGWRIEIYRNGVFEDVTFTDQDGRYQFVRPRNRQTYTFKEVAPGGFIGDNIAGAVWLATTPREFSAAAISEIVNVPNFGNVSFEVKVGVGRTKGFWHNQNGAALLQQSDPNWRDTLTTWQGSPLCLRRSISSYDPQQSIFTPLAPPASFLDAHQDFADWIVGSANGHAGFMLSTQVAAAILNSEHGFMQFTAYIDRFQNGILVSFDDMVSEVRDVLLCDPGAGMTGPQDPEQGLRAMMLNCINEFGSINNSGDPNSAQTVYGSSESPRAFNTPYAASF